jgi:hypothetical protein
MAPRLFTMTGNGRAVLGSSSGSMALYAHVRAASSLGGGTLAFQYALVDSPDPTNNAHWETLEAMSAITPGQSRPIRWPGIIAAFLAGATGPNVLIDLLADRC